MPKFIVKLDEFYLEWSTIVDAPVSLGMPLSEFKAWYRGKYGSDGMNDLPGRLARVEKTGTSSHGGPPVDDLISGNRAGPDEDELTRDELIAAYCRLEPIRNGWKAYEGGEG